MIRSTVIMTICFCLTTSALFAQERRRDEPRTDRDEVEVIREVERNRQAGERGEEGKELLLQMIERAYDQEEERPRRRADDGDSGHLANALRRVLVSRDMINPDDTMEFAIQNNNGQIRIVIEAVSTRDRPPRDAARRDRPRGEGQEEERRVERRREVRREQSSEERRDSGSDRPRSQRRTREADQEREARPSRQGERDARPLHERTREIEDIVRRLQRLERPPRNYRGDSTREIDEINRRLQRLERQLSDLARQIERRDR